MSWKHFPLIDVIGDHTALNHCEVDDTKYMSKGSIKDSFLKVF